MGTQFPANHRGSTATQVASTFLGSLFGDHAGDTRRILIWTLRDKQSQFFDSPKDAAVYAVSRAHETDVYFGVGLLSPGIASHRRGTADDVVSIPSLWADIDVQSEAHSDTRLPESKGEARKLLNVLPIKPTIVVDTGNGLQAYWLLTKPMLIQELRAEFVKAICRRWGCTLAEFATRQCGWHYDTSTHDIARVLRMPGTFNRKGTPKPVRVIPELSSPLHRYDLTEIEPLLVENSVTQKGRERTDTVLSNADTLSIADVPHDKVDTLRTNDLIFARFWDHKILPPGFKDRSPSGLDFALACLGKRAGWSDEEVAGAIASFRDRHGFDQSKAQRNDYLQRTIARAKSSSPSERPRRLQLSDGTPVILLRRPWRWRHTQ